MHRLQTTDPRKRVLAAPQGDTRNNAQNTTQNVYRVYQKIIWNPGHYFLFTLYLYIYIKKKTHLKMRMMIKFR